MWSFIHFKLMTIMYWTWNYHVSVIFTTLLVSLYSMEIPEITSYAKVSKNSAITSEARNFQSSPIYIPPKLPVLKKGETIDYTSTQKYSTLDEEMIAQLDAKTLRQQQAQDRFHPPAGFEHVIAHSNIHRLPNTPDSSISLSSASQSTGGSSSSSISSDSYATLPQNVYDTYNNYPPIFKPSKDNLPSIINDYSSSSQSDNSHKIPNSYGQQNTYEDIPTLSSYSEKFPPKSMDYSDIVDHHSTFIDDSHLHEDDHDHHYPYDLIYEHPPDYHHHHYTTTTTEEPEMNDQRLSKRPYSYYYIGKKLWYLPLYFSIYFIIYIAALVLKSIARHKINFPSNLADAVGSRNYPNNYYNGIGFWNLTQHILDAIDKFSNDNSTSSVNSKS